MSDEADRIRRIGAAFETEGSFARSRRYGNGHIHQTFLAEYAAGEGRTRFVHQRLNTDVFRSPAAVMENLARVTTHLRKALAARGVADVERRVLELVPAREGGFHHVDEAGDWRRTFRFIEGARSHETVASVEQAHEAARAFGAFLADLADLPAPPLQPTIPRFHDLGWRRSQLEDAAREDRLGRGAAVAEELTATMQALDRVAHELQRVHADALPRRTVHHDCKLNNLLLDDATGAGLCVIDLDTVMEGSVLSDFGELIRTATCAAPEHEVDLSRIRFDLDLFAALARGFRAGAGGAISEGEFEVLPIAGPVLALMNAVRFLTDHLEGDIYFRIHRAGQNLDRHRAQRRLAELMLGALDAIKRLAECSS